jgi:hypothetical protein
MWQAVKTKAILIKSQLGQMLIEVLIASAIMGVLMLGTSTILISFQKETLSLQQKVASMELEKILVAALNDGSVCQYILNNPSVQTFDSSAAFPQIIDPTTAGDPAFTIYASVTPNGANPAILGSTIASVGQPASSMTNTLMISSIKLEVVSGAGSTYLGNWTIEFDKTKVIRAIHPVIVPTLLTVDATVATATKVTGCQNFTTCIPGDVQACLVAKGTGAQTCLAGGTWSACNVTACDAGYALSNGVCLQAGGYTICEALGNKFTNYCIIPNSVTSACACPAGTAAVKGSAGAAKCTNNSGGKLEGKVIPYTCN